MSGPETALEKNFGGFLIVLGIVVVGFVAVGWITYEIRVNYKPFMGRVRLWRECRQVIKSAHHGTIHSCRALPSEYLDTPAQCLLATMFLVLIWRRRPISGLELLEKTKKRSKRYAEARPKGLSEVKDITMVGLLLYCRHLGLLTCTGKPFPRYGLAPVQEIRWGDRIVPLAYAQLDALDSHMMGKMCPGSNLR